MSLRLFSHKPDGDDQGDRTSNRNDTSADFNAAFRSFTSMSGLVFDMDDVLFDATAWRRWLLQLLTRVGLRASYKSFYRIWDRDYVGAVHRGDRSHGEAFREFLHQAGLSNGQIDEIVHASNIRKQELEADVRPFPNVRNVLWRLHAAGLRLGVLSDSELTGSVIRRRLDQMGIAGCFAAVVSSADLRQTKPAVECYRSVLENLGLHAGKTGFVGHDAEALSGARRAGMRTLAVNFDRDAVAEKYLLRFDDLLFLLERSTTTTSPRREAA